MKNLKLFVIIVVISLVAGCGHTNSEREGNNENATAGTQVVEKREENETIKSINEEFEVENEQEEKNVEEGEEVSSDKIPFTTLTTREIMNNYPSIYQYYNHVSNQDIRDYRMFFEENYEIIAVSTGLKSTGGYRLKVVEIFNEANKTIIKLEEHAPPEGAMVTQALVNPTIIFKVSKQEIFDEKKFFINDQRFQKHGISES